MKLIRVNNYDEISHVAADLIAKQLEEKPDSCLGLATGGTPIGTYQQLIRFQNEGRISFKDVHTVNLDEYYGLSADHDQSYRYYMKTNFFDGIGIDPKRTFLPDGMNTDVAAECARYDRVIESLGGVDLQLLGIGRNGHIGFNEPAAAFSKGTHCVTLTESTIEANKRYFASADEVPRKAYTMGIDTIMAARKILLLASGKEKADAVAASLQGEITPMMPASILQFHHDAILIADEEACSKLTD
jgi:glucosamine-6-phosphate deaminase